jgi:hypothetical protein
MACNATFNNISVISVLLVEETRVQEKPCESRRNVLLDHVREGYDKESWEYQDDI